jgi:hypothetical protein
MLDSRQDNFRLFGAAKRTSRSKPRRLLRRLHLEDLERRELLSATVAAALGSDVLTGAAFFAQANQHGGTGLAPASSSLTNSRFSPAAVKLPAAPSFAATAVSGTQINLAWKSVANASGYLVDEWVNGAWWQIGSLGSSATGCSIVGLSPGNTYYFDVGAFNAAGASWANYQSATTKATVSPPAAPSFTATAISGTQINLAWKAVSGATGYLVDEWINGAWQQIASVGSGATGYSVTGLSSGTTYYLDLAAYNSAGTSWANYQSATTTATVTPPAAPSLTATAVSSTQINLGWNTVSGATGYLVDELVNGSWTQVASLGSGATSYSATGLSPGTTYSFDVAAYNAAGTSWATSQGATTPSSATTIDHPAAAAAYTPATGSLFGSGGPSYLDVQQGEVGDCWLMASLAEVAARDPADIQGMFTAAGTTVENGSTVSLYTVRLYNSAGVAGYFTVDTELPAGGAYYDQATSGVLWAALAEKAYAQANGAGWVTSASVGSDSYNALNGGDPAWALQAITGKPASDYSINPTNLAAAWNAGQLVVLGSSPNANDNLVVGDSQGTHAYAVVSYNASSSTPFELYNPWGISSVVGSTVSYNGKQVYGGPFYASAALIAQDFAAQCFGTGANYGMSGLGSLKTSSPAALSVTMAGRPYSNAGDSLAPTSYQTGLARPVGVPAEARIAESPLSPAMVAQDAAVTDYLHGKADRDDWLLDAEPLI